MKASNQVPRWIAYGRRLCPLILIACLAACSRDPNDLKKKYLANGDRYYALGKFREASIMYRTAIKKDPRYAEAYLHNARALLKLNLVSAAEPSLRRAVELLPEGAGRVEARVTLGGLYLVYLEVVRFEKPIAGETGRLADELIHLDSRSYDGFRIRGTLGSLAAANSGQKFFQLAQEQLQQAISDLRTADAIRPFQAEILVPLGRSLWARGQPAEAENMLVQTIKSRPGLAAAYSELYRMYSRVRRPAESEGILKLAIENNPKQYSFLVELAGLYRSFGRRAEMTKTLDTLKAHAAEFPSAYEVAGNMYLQSGDFRLAVREYEQGAAAFPKEKAGYQRLIVEALVTGNQRVEAEAVNEFILKGDPKDTQALARRAGFLLERGDADKSIAQSEALLRETPNHYLARYNLGRALIAKGRREDARFQFSESVRWAPKFIPARIALAQVQLATGEYGNAVLSAEETLSLDDKNDQAMLIRAIGLRDMGKYEEARTAFEALLKIYPKHDGALLQLGGLNALQLKFKEAEAAYRESYEANPGNLGGLMAIVNSHLARKETEEALKILEAEAQKHPDRVDLSVALADTEMQAGRHDLAIAGLQLLLKKLENNPRAAGDIHIRIAECYKRTGALDTAVAHLQQARQLLPENSTVLHNLGVLHDMLGKKGEASGFYRASLKINGEDGVVLNNLAYYMAENGGDLDQALTFAQRARQKMPDELAFADTLGCIYLKKNLVENALEILEDLVVKKPDEAVFRMHLGEALLKKGETARAKKELRSALAGKPSPGDAAKIKELLARNAP